MMNTRAWIVVVAVMGALTLMSFSPSRLQAQSPMSVDVPFDFYVGSQKLPAGKYAVKHMTDPAVLQVSDGNGHASVTLSIGHYGRSAKHTGRLVFTRYGAMYFLSEVHWLDSPLSRQLMKSPLEIQIARNAAPERVTASTNNR